MRFVTLKTNSRLCWQLSACLGLIVLAAAQSAWPQSQSARSGWLYVLDTENAQGTSHIFLTDPAKATIVRTITAGADPDAALAPDGSLLYVASKYPDKAKGKLQDRLEIYDASGSQIASIPNPDTIATTVPWYPTRMAVSPSGSWLYMVKMRVVNFNDIYLTAFNTATRQFLPTHVPLTGCKAPVLLPAAEDLKLSVVCNGSAIVREIALGETDESTKVKAIPVIPGQTGRALNWHLAYLHPSTDKVGLIAHNGASFAVNKQLEQVEILAAPRAQASFGKVPKTLPTQRGVVSKDETSVYFGDQTTARPYSESCDQIVGADPMTLTPKQTIRTPVPFFTFALSSDGKIAYTVSPEKSEITVIDMASAKPLRQFHVGKTPMMVFAVP